MIISWCFCYYSSQKVLSPLEFSRLDLDRLVRSELQFSRRLETKAFARDILADKYRKRLASQEERVHSLYPYPQITICQYVKQELRILWNGIYCIQTEMGRLVGWRMSLHTIHNYPLKYFRYKSHSWDSSLIRQVIRINGRFPKQRTNFQLCNEQKQMGKIHHVMRNC